MRDFCDSQRIAGVYSSKFDEDVPRTVNKRQNRIERGHFSTAPRKRENEEWQNAVELELCRNCPENAVALIECQVTQEALPSVFDVQIEKIDAAAP